MSVTIKPDQPHLEFHGEVSDRAHQVALTLVEALFSTEMKPTDIIPAQLEALATVLIMLSPSKEDAHRNAKATDGIKDFIEANWGHRADILAHFGVKVEREPRN